MSGKSALLTSLLCSATFAGLNLFVNFGASSVAERSTPLPRQYFRYMVMLRKRPKDPSGRIGEMTIGCGRPLSAYS